LVRGACLTLSSALIQYLIPVPGGGIGECRIHVLVERATAMKHLTRNNMVPQQTKLRGILNVSFDLLKYANVVDEVILNGFLLRARYHFRLGEWVLLVR
jgi:hypothetical protein